MNLNHSLHNDTVKHVDLSFYVEVQKDNRVGQVIAKMQDSQRKCALVMDQGQTDRHLYSARHCPPRDRSIRSTQRTHRNDHDPRSAHPAIGYHTHRSHPIYERQAPPLHARCRCRRARIGHTDALCHHQIHERSLSRRNLQPTANTRPLCQRSGWCLKHSRRNYGRNRPRRNGRIGAF